jgi:hypothetical protein
LIREKTDAKKSHATVPLIRKITNGTVARVAISLLFQSSLRNIVFFNDKDDISVMQKGMLSHLDEDGFGNSQGWLIFFILSFQVARFTGPAEEPLSCPRIPQIS